MLIRSQDKTIIINFERITGITVDENGVWASDTPRAFKKDTLFLGKYSTKSKAIKVLDMIEKSYVESLWTESHYDYSAQSNVSEVVANNIVFQMPQESEV